MLVIAETVCAQGGTWELSVLSAQIVCEHKTLDLVGTVL